jgi:DNA transformation protein
MAVDEGLVAWVTEALEPVGAVTMRRMMGGATLYLGGAIVRDRHFGRRAAVQGRCRERRAVGRRGYRERFSSRILRTAGAAP